MNALLDPATRASAAVSLGFGQMSGANDWLGENSRLASLLTANPIGYFGAIQTTQMVHDALQSGAKNLGGDLNSQIAKFGSSESQLALNVASMMIPLGQEETVELKGEALVEKLAAEKGAVRISQKGLDLIVDHLAQFEDYAPNAGMIQRLQDAFAAGQKVTGADANFYLHEASEATMMARGLIYDVAHAAALEKFGVSNFSLYHPKIIQAFPALFNNAWRAFWGLPPNP